MSIRLSFAFAVALLAATAQVRRRHGDLSRLCGVAWCNPCECRGLKPRPASYARASAALTALAVNTGIIALRYSSLA